MTALPAVLDIPLPAEDDLSARAASLRSRAAVQSGDRDAWLALFAPDAVVADPVGPSAFDPAGDGHRGADARAAFWDQVIAPNRVRMDIHGSYAGGSEVANVITVVTTLPDGTRALVPGIAVYNVDDAGLILSLRAFWEMDQLTLKPPAPAK